MILVLRDFVSKTMLVVKEPKTFALHIIFEDCDSVPPPTTVRDNLPWPTSPSGSGMVADDFLVYASKHVTTRSGFVPQLKFGTDRGWK